MMWNEEFSGPEESALRMLLAPNLLAASPAVAVSGASGAPSVSGVLAGSYPSTGPGPSTGPVAPPPVMGIGGEVLSSLRALIPADRAIAVTLDIGRRQLLGVTAVPIAVHVPDTERFRSRFWVAFDECLACSAVGRPDSKQAVWTISDFYTPAQMRRTKMYGMFGAAVSADYVMFATLPSATGTETRVMLIRADRDFDGHERLILALLLPHLVARHRRSLAATPLSHLTPRQRTVIGLVARGYTNDAIARRLGVSTGTVRKHLDNAFHVLGVKNRTEAVTRAFPDGVPAGLAAPDAS